MTAPELARIAADIAACRACPRLVEWRERAAAERVARFRDVAYWGRQFQFKVKGYNPRRHASPPGPIQPQKAGAVRA
jgi:hypothetical protein